jgi:hypothetical protein
MALSNQRFVTTWTSEDSIQWRMYIIPSSVDYISPALSSNVTLPSEFLLRDMSLDTELGSIPAGLVSQVLKINVNIAALQGSDALNDLRTDLLRGTTAKRVPLNSDGSEYLASDLTEAQREFDAFNTFVLQYNDGSGFKTAFIGCQKYSAENELEITALDNVITYTIEIFDIHRCIGEIINQTIWTKALKCTNDPIYWGPLLTQPENTEIRDLYIGYPYINIDRTDGSITLKDYVVNDGYMHISTFERLKSKISTMYSAYMRAMTQKLASSFIADSLFSKTCIFKNNQNGSIQVSYTQLAYIAEIWINVDGTLTLAGGAYADKGLFAQFTNFYEVYKNLIEGSIETLRLSYAFTSGTPDAYTVTMVADNPYPFDYQMTFNEDNTFSSLKIKLFSEALNQVNVTVTNINGDRDTTEYGFGKQGTSGDNSKDIKIMYHNLPLITYRTSYKEEGGQIIWARNTVNAGTILYYDLTGFTKVNTNLSIFFGGEDFGSTYPPSPFLKRPEYQLILEQQNSGLPTTMAQAMVNFLGRSKQAEATLTTTFSTAKFNHVAKRCIIDLSDYNTLLESIYGTPQAYAVMTKHSHKIYEGMADITLRIDAESE